VESRTERQTEVNNWVISKLDVEEYTWLLKSAGSVGYLCCFLDDLLHRISRGYKPNEKEFAVCFKLGLIRKEK
jgi:hypothetical protein